MTQSPTDETVEAVALKPFEREERFIVVKRKNLSAIQETALRAHMSRLGVGTVECVVVESDWPEYEAVWQMIEQRVTRASIPASPPSPAGDVERVRYDKAAQDAVMTLLERGKAVVDNDGYLRLAALHPSPSPASNDLASELEALMTAETNALNTIKNQDHSSYNRAHRNRMLWLKENSGTILDALQSLSGASAREVGELARLRAMEARIRAALEYSDPIDRTEIDAAIAADLRSGLSLRKSATKHGTSVGIVRGIARTALTTEGQGS